MQRLVIEDGQKKYIDLTRQEIEQVNQRIADAEQKEAERAAKQAAKRQAVLRLRQSGDSDILDILKVLELDSD